MRESSVECETCGAPATTTTRVGHDAIALCDRCKDKMVVRDAFDAQLLNLVELERSDPERALDILKDLQRAYDGRDHDGWLDRSVRAHRAHIFIWNGRYDEALRELRGLRELLKPGSRESAENQQTIAFALDRAGAPSEAIAELEQGLTELEAGPPEDAGVRARVVLDLLSSYARIADAQGWDIKPRYGEVVHSTMTACGIQVPARAESSSSLNDIVLYANSMTMEAERRYAALVKRLKAETGEAGAKMVDEYLASEPVGFYRELASKSFREHT